jgi:ABC-type dipeptide/oligopeptide/nickel transport system permease component
MLRVVLRRVAIGVPVVIGVSAIIFFVLRVLPGNPVQVITQNAPTTPGERHDIIVEFGLDKPLLRQYLSYLGNAIHGDFGLSFQTSR